MENWCVSWLTSWLASMTVDQSMVVETRDIMWMKRQRMNCSKEVSRVDPKDRYSCSGGLSVRSVICSRGGEGAGLKIDSSVPQ